MATGIVRIGRASHPIHVPALCCAVAYAEARSPAPPRCAAAHLSGGDASGLLDMPRWSAWSHNIDWRARLSGEDGEEFLARVRAVAYRGNALANDDFITRLEKRMGTTLRHMPVGRPKKK